MANTGRDFTGCARATAVGWGGVPLFASLQLVAKCRCRWQCHRNPNPRPLPLLPLGSPLPPPSSPGVVVYFHSALSPVLCLLPLSPWSSSRSTASSAEIEPRLRGAREQGLCSRLIFQPVHWLPWTSTCALCLRLATPSSSFSLRQRPTLEIPNDDNPLRGGIWETAGTLRRIRRLRVLARPRASVLSIHAEIWKNRSKRIVGHLVHAYRGFIGPGTTGAPRRASPGKYIHVHTYFRSDRTHGLSGPAIICICAYTQYESVLLPTAKFPPFLPGSRSALFFLAFVTSFFLLFSLLPVVFSSLVSRRTVVSSSLS